MKHWKCSVLIWAGVLTATVVSAENPHEQTLKPLFSRYCFECHSNTAQKAELNVQQIVEGKGGLSSMPKVMEDIQWAIEEEEMPPRSAKLKLPAKERKTMLAAVNALLKEVRERKLDDPGKVVMPRLTPDQYNNVIRDITGVPIDAARFFPGDGGAGEGFTNVGEAHVITPGHLEKYLSAAKEVLQYARIMPVEDGLVFEPRKLPPVDTPEAVRKYLLNDLKDWYGNQDQALTRSRLGQLRKKYNRVHSVYWEAAWRYRHREALGKADADFAAIAAEYDGLMSPQSLERWYRILTEPKGKLGRFVNELATKWQALPHPGKVETAELGKMLYRMECEYMTVASAMVFRPRIRVKFRHKPKEGRLKGSRKFGAKLDKVKTLYLVQAAGGDGTEEDVANWFEGVFVFGKDKTEPWQDHIKSFRDQNGKMVTWTKPGELLLQAPAALAFDVPEGAKELHLYIKPHSERGKNGSIQTLITDEKPSAEQLAFYSVPKLSYGGRAVWGAKGSERVKSFSTDSRKASRVLSTAVIGGTAKRNYRAEVNVTDDFGDVVDQKYLGGSWEKQHKMKDDPTQPYFFTAPMIRREASSKAMKRLAELKTWLKAGAQAPHQDMQAFLEKQGLKLKEGVLPTEQEVRTWDAATQAEYRRLASAVDAVEKDYVAIARKDIARLARRAWRRPLDEKEIDDLVAFYTAERSRGISYENSVKLALRVVFVSPYFLYQLQPMSDIKTRKLNSYEIASRLSFMIWGSIPDDELMKLAEADRLKDPQVIREQARRMFKNWRARAFSSAFAGEWLDFAGFDRHRDPDGERFPKFDESLAGSMYEESLLFFLDMFQNNRPIINVLTADYAFLNRRLASHYGIKGVDDEEFKMVKVPTDERGGILAMGSILTKTSVPLRTSPVLRGVWLLENVLGEHLPDPPPNVPMLSDDEVNKEGMTIPQQLARHRADPACSSCHDRIDPLGIPLENFDPIGRWRSKDSKGNPVARVGEFKTGRKLDGFADLRAYLMTRKDDIAMQFCRKLLGYSLGRAVSVGDDALLAKMMKALKANEYRFMSALDVMLGSRQFLERRDFEGPEE